jgi:hypothetical protein
MPILLTDLPNELIEAIVAALCGDLDASPGTLASGINPGHGCLSCDRTRLAALNALCRTSRLFYEISLPHLYHRVSPGSNCRMLLRTLVTRPDLAQHVRSLCWVGMGCYRPLAAIREELQNDKAVVGAFVDRMEEFLATLPPEVRREFEGNAERELGLFLRHYTNIPLDIAITFLPNIETLIAELDQAPIFLFCSPGMLPRLRQLYLSYSDVRGVLRMWMILRLLEATRDSLETVVLQMCDTKIQPYLFPFRWDAYDDQFEALDVPEEPTKLGYFKFTVPNVTRLAIRDWILDHRVLRLMFATFPNIAHLHFQIVGPRCLGRNDRCLQNPLHWIAAVFRSPDCVPKLRCFVLEVEETFDTWEKWWNESTSRSLIEAMENRGVEFEFRHPKPRLKRVVPGRLRLMSRSERGEA